MTQENIEGEAALVLEKCGYDDGEPPEVVKLARRLLGVAVQSVHARALPGDGSTATVNGQRRIYVRCRLPTHRLRWAIAHELGHVVLGLDSGSVENEDACDAFAAALLAPRRAFRAAVDRNGVNFQKLAMYLQTTESFAALRLGEVTGCPLVLVTPTSVRVRGDTYGWPTDIRNSRISNAECTKLKDDRRRVVLRIA